MYYLRGCAAPALFTGESANIGLQERLVVDRAWLGPVCDGLLGSAKVLSQVSLNLAVKLPISFCELYQSARMMSIMARFAFFESDYLIATALTSLNVVWPSRTF